MMNAADALASWTSRKEGAARVHVNAEGWMVRKASSRGWIICRPDGVHADRLTWQSVLAAQLRTHDYMADPSRMATQ